MILARARDSGWFAVWRLKPPHFARTMGLTIRTQDLPLLDWLLRIEKAMTSRPIPIGTNVPGSGAPDMAIVPKANELSDVDMTTLAISPSGPREPVSKAPTLAE